MPGIHRWGWIIGPRDDLVYFIGSALVGYAYWAGVVWAGLPVALLWWVWAIVFDAPHLFATATRTYLDAEVRTERPLLLWGSLAWFAVGPLAVWSGAAPVFFAFAYLWAYVHLVKQHYGFMVLYKKRAGEEGGPDAVFLRIAFYAPYVAALFSNREMFDVVRRTVPGAEAAASFVVPAAVGLAAAATVAYAVHEAVVARPNPPKWLLLAATVSLHWVVLASTSMSVMAMTMTLTIVHNIQYHRIVWHHNAKYRPAGAEARHGGLCAALARHFLAYAALGVAFAVFYRFPRWYNMNVEPRADWIEAAFWGFAFVHYWLDGRIWRVRRDPRLAEGVLRPA